MERAEHDYILETIFKQIYRISISKSIDVDSIQYLLRFHLKMWDKGYLYGKQTYKR